jgi:putative endopeptidase
VAVSGAYNRKTVVMKPPITLLLAVCPFFCVTLPARTPESAQVGAFGIDLSAQETSVKPGDDFYRYANGHWLATEQIPPDRTRWGIFDELREQSETAVRSVIEAAAAGRNAPGRNERKIADYYQSFLDTDAIERLGLAPAQHGLDAIAALKTHEQAAVLIATPGMALKGPVGWTIAVDDKDPDRYTVNVGQSGLSLPDRDYYLKNDPQSAAVRAQFQTHVEKMLVLAGHTHAKTEAAQVLALETEIAQLHWDRVQRRQRELTYNPMSLVDLQKEAPAYPWAAALRASGLRGIRQVVVAEKSAIAPLAKLFEQTPVETLKSYLTYQFLTSEAAVLPRAFDTEDFAFNGVVLYGQPQQRQRWERSVWATNIALGEAVGRLYVAKEFPPQSKADMETLVDNLRKAFARHLQDAAWMTPETRRLALEKLAAFHAKIGYPNQWRDYSALRVAAGDAFGNKTRAEIFEWNRQVRRLGKPTDREEWTMTPQTVNAYYNSVFNEVVFPAAILRPPLFDPGADAAVNYGAIGAVIGHEMSHGFDDQGAKSDAQGVLRTWWKPEDVNSFKTLTGRLADQYDHFEPLPGLHINGHLTLGENIADLAGLTIAHDAYLISLNGAAPAVIAGTTGDQRFFLGLAQIYRALQRDNALRVQILSDPHSPDAYRVNGVVENIDAWYVAFNVKPDDKLYLKPEDRIKIW